MDTENEILISSRVRLARNLKNYKFPIKMTEDEANKVINDTKEALYSKELNYKLYYMKDLSDTEKNVLIEKHLISPDLAEQKDRGAFFLSNDEKVSIMINEEDHIRIQTMGPGMCLRECWELANEIDDILEEKLDFAFDRELGYITSCPTNIGTGIRASVMIHLPALCITTQTEKLMYGISQLGVAVRGVYGEGTKSMGHLYQISNQGTLGASEETLIDKIAQIVLQIAEKEKLTRELLRNKNYDELEDEVFRAFGLLTNARSMTTDESMKLLSLVKLGKEMDIIESLKNKDLYKLMISVQPNNILSIENKQISIKDRDIKRSQILRNELL